VRLWALSDVGKARTENQDAVSAEIYIPEKTGIETAICVVCDGMGGAKAGGYAAALAADTFVKTLKSGLELQPVDDDLLRRCAALANEAVYTSGRSKREYRGMGTTLVAAVGDGEMMKIINVGDSRCYTVSEKGIVQVTKDHSLVEDMVDRGEILREEAWRHPNKNYITRALGTDIMLRCDVFSLYMNPEEYLLLCTDGLTGVVNPQELLFELIYGGDTESAAQRMLDIALSRGAPDNVSLILMQK